MKLSEERSCIIMEIIRDVGKQKKDFLKDRAINKKKLNVTDAQGEILHFLFESGGARVSDIGEALEVSSSAVTQMIDVLIEKKYITRKTDEKDRRVVNITLTTKTKNLFATFKSDSIASVSSVFSVLDDEELNVFFRLHRKIVDACLARKENNK